MPAPKELDPTARPTGLAQTEEYARVLFIGEPDSTSQQVEEAIQARLERQTIFNRPAPPQYLAVMDEGILYRPIGDGFVLRRQLEHLITMAENNWFNVQLIPYEALCTAVLVRPSSWRRRMECRSPHTSNQLCTAAPSTNLTRSNGS